MAVAAWGVGLLAVIGGAIAGGHSGGDAAPSAVGAVPSAAADAIAHDANLRSPGTADATDRGRFGDDTSIPVVVLDTPSEANAVITTLGIEVRGRVREGGGPVVVMLESSTADRLIVVTVYPVRVPDSGGAPTSAFIGTLPIPDPRPIGPAFVRILGFDASGTAAHIVVRPIRIGALLDPTYGDGSERPPTGEDGLMGGITSGTNFAWRADGGSPAANDP